MQNSVLIPTRERPRQLDACIKSLPASDYESFELIVVDQSPEPNGLLELASGHLFATTDDCTASQDWLTWGHERFEAQQVDMTYRAPLAILLNNDRCFASTQRCASRTSHP